jgi:hypothetical protein
MHVCEMGSYLRKEWGGSLCTTVYEVTACCQAPLPPTHTWLCSIYTMCVPVKENQVMGSFQDLQDLATARNEVRLTSHGQYLNTDPCGSLLHDSA